MNIDGKFINDSLKCGSEDVDAINELGCFVNVSNSYFLAIKNMGKDRRAFVTFGPISFPVMGKLKAANVCKASGFADERKAVIGLWKNIEFSINELGYKKLRRAKTLGNIGVMANTALVGSHTMYNMIGLCCGEISSVSRADVLGMCDFVRNGVDKRAFESRMTREDNNKETQTGKVVSVMEMPSNSLLNVDVRGNTSPKELVRETPVATENVGERWKRTLTPRRSTLEIESPLGIRRTRAAEMQESIGTTTGGARRGRQGGVSGGLRRKNSSEGWGNIRKSSKTSDDSSIEEELIQKN